jgi:hypothetical protein
MDCASHYAALVKYKTSICNGLTSDVRGSPVALTARTAPVHGLSNLVCRSQTTTLSKINVGLKVTDQVSTRLASPARTTGHQRPLH